MFEKFIEEIKTAKTIEALECFNSEIIEMEVKIKKIKTESVRMHLCESIEKIKRISANRFMLLKTVSYIKNAEKIRNEVIKKFDNLFDEFSDERVEDLLSFIDSKICSSEFKFIKEYNRIICNLLEKAYTAQICGLDKDLVGYLNKLYYEFNNALTSKYNIDIPNIDSFDDIIVNDDNSISFK